MHDDELEVDVDLVTRLVGAQFPQWRGLPVRAVASTGTVNALFRLGDDLCVRLPRTPSVCPTSTGSSAGCRGLRRLSPSTCRSRWPAGCRPRTIRSAGRSTAGSPVTSTPRTWWATRKPPLAPWAISSGRCVAPRSSGVPPPDARRWPGWTASPGTRWRPDGRRSTSTQPPSARGRPNGHRGPLRGRAQRPTIAALAVHRSSASWSSKARFKVLAGWRRS